MHLRHVALALNHISDFHAAVGAHGESVVAAEEAVGFSREHVAVNPAALPTLARSLNNLSERYHRVARFAARSAEEVIGLLRPLAVAMALQTSALAMRR
ncbi:hypothetical protein ACFQV2_31390 [Actinokineospora soli]|uniref:Uncharacterized protein n=1 Tax=Actinokineospora soli TaxID=1048753 RepID=A0ABW2TU63_9PSEU